MEFLRYTHVFFMLFVWIYALIFLGPKRVRELLPVGVIALLVLFVIEQFLLTLNLYQFINPLVNIYGTPLYHLIWGAGSGIVYIHYMKRGFSKQVVIVIFFALLTTVIESITEAAGVASHLGGFTEVHEFFIDILALVLLKWISIGLYGGRILKDDMK